MFTASVNNANQITPKKYWVEDNSIENIPCNSCVVVPGDYIIENATLNIESSINTLTVANTLFNKIGALQIAKNLLIKNGSITGNGLIVIGGLLIVEGTISIAASLELNAINVADLPIVGAGETVIFKDIDNGVIKKKQVGGITNY